MPTQEERIVALEKTTREHRAALQTLAYDLTIVKGFVTAQGDAIQEIKDDIEASFKQLVAYQIKIEEQIDTRFNQVDARFNQIDTRFNQVDARLDKIEATMATKDDIANMATKDDMTAMENRILNAFQQLVTMINAQRPQSE
jgi:chromosome segregation ATPase